MIAIKYLVTLVNLATFGGVALALLEQQQAIDDHDGVYNNKLHDSSSSLLDLDEDAMLLARLSLEKIVIEGIFNFWGTKRKPRVLKLHSLRIRAMFQWKFQELPPGTSRT